MYYPNFLVYWTWLSARRKQIYLFSPLDFKQALQNLPVWTISQTEPLNFSLSLAWITKRLTCKHHKVQANLISRIILSSSKLLSSAFNYLLFCLMRLLFHLFSLYCLCHLLLWCRSSDAGSSLGLFLWALRKPLPIPTARRPHYSVFPQTGHGFSDATHSPSFCRGPLTLPGCPLG